MFGHSTVVLFTVYNNSFTVFVLVILHKMKARLNYEQRKFAINYCNRHSQLAPTRLSLYCIRDKFNRTASIMDALGSGRRVSVCTQENQQTVPQAYVISPNKSTWFIHVSIKSQINQPGDTVWRPIFFVCS